MAHDQRGREFLANLADHSQNLPFSPVILQELFKATDRSSMASMGTVAGIVSKDQGLTVRLLNLANSAFYGLSGQVTTIDRAVTLLGMTEVRNMALLTGVKAMTEKHQPPDEFDLHGYWIHNLQVAVIVRELAAMAGVEDPSILYAAGMLHDVGKLLVALYAPEDWKAMRAMCQETPRPCHVVENQYWSLEHGMVGGMALSAWNLPPLLSEPVNWHHSPATCKEHQTEARLLHLADILARNLDALLADPQALPEELMPEALDAMLQEGGRSQKLEDFFTHLQELLEEHNIGDMARALS